MIIAIIVFAFKCSKNSCYSPYTFPAAEITNDDMKEKLEKITDYWHYRPYLISWDWAKYAGESGDSSATSSGNSAAIRSENSTATRRVATVLPPATWRGTAEPHVYTFYWVYSS
jgi:hypothetical protein